MTKSSYQKRNAFVILFVLCYAYLGATQTSYSVSMSPTTINMNAAYSFTIIDSIFLSRDGNIVLTFPTGKFSLSSLNCYVTNSPTQVYTCSVSGGNIVTIVYTRGTFTSPYQYITIQTIKNPSSKQSLTFGYDFISGGNTFSTNSWTFDMLTPDTLASCSVSFSPSTVFTQSTATFSLTTKNTVDVGGMINLLFPSSWLNSVPTYTALIYTATTCTKVSGASLNNILTCDIVQPQVSVLSAFSSIVSAGSTIVFTATRIRTPPTTASGNTVTITTQTLAGNEVDSSACQVSPVIEQAFSITLASTTSFMVGADNVLIMSWFTASPLRVGDVLTIGLPLSSMIFTQSQINSITLIYNNKLAGRSVSAGNSSIQLRVTISSLFNPDTEISPGMQIQLSVVVQCLIDTSPKTVSLTISRSSSNIAIGSLTLTPISNILVNTSIQSSLRTVSAPMSLSLTFTTTNILSVGSVIKVQVPSSLPLISGSPTPSCSISSPSSPSSIMATISCSLSSYIITVSNFLQTALIGGSTLVLTISNTFKNADTTQPTSAFIISTYSSAGNLVDQDNTLTYSALPGIISIITITPVSYQVGASTVYTLDYTLSRTLNAGTSIVVKLPIQLTMTASPSFSSSLNNGAYTIVSPSIVFNGSSVTLTFTGIIATQQVAGANLKIRFMNLINPYMMTTTSSFSIDVSYNNYPIQSLSSGLTVTMTTMANWLQLFPLQSSPQNGAIKDYTFYIKPQFVIANNSQIKVEIVDTTGNTNEISFSSTVTCNIYYGSTTLINTCSAVSKIITIILTGALSDTTGSTQYRLVLSTLILARTPKISSNFKVTSFTPTGLGVHEMNVNSIVNTLPNYIQSLVLNVLTAPSQLNSLEQLRLTIKTYNGLDLINGQFFVIQIPNSFTYVGTNTSTLCTGSTFNCTIYNSNNNAIKVSASASYSTVGLVKDFIVTLTDSIYVSPTVFEFSTDYFYVTSYTNNSLIIDTTDPINVAASKTTFFRTCGGKCFTCSASNTTICSTCYAINTGVISGITYGGYNTMTSDFQCVDVCGDGYYNSSATCIACVSPCKNCISASQCTSCIAGFYFVSTNPINNRCPNSCTIGFFANIITNTCDSCSSSCVTCSGTPNTCTSCNGTYYLSAGQCILSCPDGQFQNALTNSCLPCDVGCLLVCDINATNCIGGCKTGYVKINSTSSQCVNTCPNGLVKNSITGVCECSTSCLACSGIVSNCTSCNSTLILYMNTCIGQCPANTYKPTGIQSCITCTDVNCSVCNATSCITCQSNTYLYAGSCVVSCPLGTRIQSYQCKICPVGCKTCLTATICTSCFPNYLTQSDQCVTTCTSPLINFNATTCVSECPIGYYNNNGRCDLSPSNNNNTTPNSSTNTNSTVTVASIGKIVPFPYTIAYVLVIGVSIGMRCLYPSTLLPSVIMSIGSIPQILSAITLVIVNIVNTGELQIGGIIVIVMIGLIYLSNIVVMVLIVKVLHNDSKFMQTYRKTVSPNTTIRLMSLIFYHKFHQIVFSNIFGVKVFCNKVDFVKRLYPFNVLLIISVFLSVGIVVGASIISYNVQQALLSSSSFIQSVDTIVIVVLNIIPTILVLRRKSDDYEQDLNDKEAKRYETQDQLAMNNQSAGMEQVFIQQSGDVYGKPNAVGQSRKNYFYQNTKRSQNGQDPYQNPLSKKRSSIVNPLNATTALQQGQKSSQSLFFGDKSKMKSKLSNDVQQVSQEIQQILLQEPRGDQSMPNQRKIKGQNQQTGKQKDPMLNYTGYDLDPSLLKLNQNSQEFKKLPSQTKAKIRLAKANLQINKNSKSINGKPNNDQGDVEQIQLSPKKLRGDSQLRNSAGQDEASGVQLLNQTLKSANNNLKKSKSKSKSKSKDKKGAKSPIKDKNLAIDSDGNGNNEGKQKQQAARMVRNQSQQMNKKQLLNKGVKTTKSQNIKKKGKNVNNQIKVLFNGNSNAHNQNQNQNENSKNNDFVQQDEPTLPVFKHRSKSKGKKQENAIYATDSDGFADNIQQQKNRNGNRSQIFDDKNLNNLRKTKGDHTIPNQQSDQLPHLHSSQQLSNLVVINKNKKNRRQKQLQFLNDDESIYNKIYQDDTQTLKSVQGDNLFGNDISPSQFNVQNQRFQQTDVSNNDMPVPASIDLVDQNQNDLAIQDQFDQSNIRRYESTHNIDYDSVISKRLNNDKIKQLQKIYLPRLEVIKPQKKKKK